jgi:hypothetical protein
MTHKSLFIRCSEDTYKLAHALAKKENRSLNKQMIHMIHALADEKNVSVDDHVAKEEVIVHTTPVEPKWGLTGLVETKKQGFDDQ